MDLYFCDFQFIWVLRDVYLNCLVFLWIWYQFDSIRVEHQI